MPEFDDHAKREAGRLAASFDTFAKCRERMQAGTGRLCHAIERFPDGRLEEEIFLPFGGGVSLTMADVLALHGWNLTYHLGQINYLQTLLGDRAMH